MKKFLVFAIITIFSVGALNAQTTDSTAIQDTAVINKTDSAATKPAKKRVVAAIKHYDLSRRPIDHFIFQFGYSGWSNQSDPYTLSGFSRQFNAAFMMDYPFKSDPHYSFGYGIGYSSDNFFMNGKYADITSTTSTTLPVSTNNGSVNDFKKFKIVCNYAEIPLELRYSADAEKPDKAFRIAVGVKGGWLFNVHSKGKGQLNSAGQMVTSNYIQKLYSKQFFNPFRAVGTLRLGLGMVNIFATYQLTPLLKSNAGPTLNPYSVGVGLGIM
jgi:hypothetical protein